MKESVTYQAILEEGEARGEVRGVALGRLQKARNILIDLASNRLGVPTAQVLARIDRVEAKETLERWIRRVYQVESWDELLAGTPGEEVI